MDNVVSRRLFLAGLGSVALPVGAAIAANPAVSPRPVARPSGLGKRRIPDAHALIDAAKLSGAVTFAVADVRNGQVLESQEIAGHLPPASVMKSVTALYALATLGPAHRFHTRLIATGPVVNGVLAGDLVLAGGGDPTLDTDGLADMARALKESGVREVRGAFRVWGGALPFANVIDDAQPDHAGYNPAISGLNLNYNRVHFEWKKASKGWAVTMDARSAHYRPDVAVAKMKIVSRNVPVYTYSDAGGADNWTVASGALGNGGARWLPVRKPELYAGDVLASIARSHGIVLRAPKMAASAPRGDVLATRSSLPLDQMLRAMLKYSTNLTAEAVGMAATRARVGRALDLRASAREMQKWAAQDLGIKGARFVDHSGLGDQSRMSASGLAQALAGAASQGQLPGLLKEIVLKNKDGTPNRSHPIKVHAKTGTLNFVSALAGYMTTSDGRVLSFAIFTGDIAHRKTLTKAQRERPSGGRTWNGRAKRLQQALIERWNGVYSA